MTDKGFIPPSLRERLSGELKGINDGRDDVLMRLNAGRGMVDDRETTTNDHDHRELKGTD